MEKVLIENSIHMDLSRQKTHRPQGAYYTPYGAWIGLKPILFSQMPQKCHLPKISS